MKRDINLFIQSEYSLLASSVKIDELVNQNCTCLGIADYNNMHGVYKFFVECKKNKIKPIVGLTLDAYSHNKIDNKVCLYAINVFGYKNLMKIASEIKSEGFIDLSTLKERGKGLALVIPSFESEFYYLMFRDNKNIINDLLYEYNLTFDKVYFGIDLNNKSVYLHKEKIKTILKEMKLKIIPFHKTNYLLKEDKEVYRILRKIKLSKLDYDFLDNEENAYFIKENNEEYDEEWINNLNEFLDFEDCIDLKTHYIYPRYLEVDETEFFENLCKKGLNKRLNGSRVDFNVYRERLLKEIEVIKKMNYVSYFLIVYDYIKYAKSIDIMVGPGRGSAPGSLVAYSLGITNVDPIKYNLLFERFLNEERISMPDIDIDFQDDRREEVFDYMRNKYGNERVAHITTFNTYQARLAIEDIKKVMNIKDTFFTEVKKHLPSNSYTHTPIEKLVENSKELLKLIDENSDIKRLFDLLYRIENLPKNVSVHASGVVVTDVNMNNYVPVFQSVNGYIQTQYEADDLEKIGLVKMDLLGLINLTRIKNILSLIKTNLDINTIPLDDSKTFELLQRGETSGIFQLESEGMTETLKKLRTNMFEDIIACTSLYRPGPREMIDTYVRRKSKLEKVIYLHKDLEDILSETYGIIVYQEQIMLIAKKIAGYSLAKADILRRAMSKKEHELLVNELEDFIEGSANNGYEKSLAEDIFKLILKFANYGFNKSHATCYALITFQMAYLKTHYYKEFISVLMSSSISSSSSVLRYMQEALRNNIVIDVPSINISSNKFEIINDVIYLPLNIIYGVGLKTVDEILKERNDNGLFVDFYDFLRRCEKIVSSKIICTFINGGVFDCFKVTRKRLSREYDVLRNIAVNWGTLKDEFLNEEYSIDELTKMEYDALGLNIKYNNFSLLRKELKVDDLSVVSKLSNISLVIMIDSVKIVKTKNNDEMAFISAHDEYNSINITLFADNYKLFRNVLDIKKYYLVKGRVEKRNESYQIILSYLELLKVE